MSIPATEAAREDGKSCAVSMVMGWDCRYLDIRDGMVVGFLIGVSFEEDGKDGEWDEYSLDILRR